MEPAIGLNRRVHCVATCYSDQVCQMTDFRFISCPLCDAIITGFRPGMVRMPIKNSLVACPALCKKGGEGSPLFLAQLKLVFQTECPLATIQAKIFIVLVANVFDLAPQTQIRIELTGNGQIPKLITFLFCRRLFRGRLH